MKIGAGVQGEVRRIVHEGVSCVVKSPRHGIRRFFSQWILKREFRIYQKLQGVDGIPKCYGLTSDGLVLEEIDARPLSEFRKGQISIEFLDRLDRLISEIHGRGVAHSDLKKRENVLVLEKPEARSQNPEERGQRPVIIDFGAAFVQGDMFYETFRRIDLAAAAKLREHHQPATLRPEQSVLLTHPTWAERLSRFLIRTVRDPFRRIQNSAPPTR